MKMRWIEKLAMNSPLRSWMLRRWEVPRVLDGLELPAGCACLEIGCGAGAGALLIARRFGCGRLACVDIDPAMIRRARRVISRPPRWARGVPTGAIELIEGDAAAMGFADATFDAAFLFGVLHHIADWRGVIEEVARVLVPGGVFAFEEALLGRHVMLANRYFGHTPFGPAELEEAVAAAGLRAEKFEVGFLKRMCYCRAVKPAD